MRLTSPLVPLLLMLSSCSSPPRPPTVDESLKRPANAAAAVSLQVCEGELQNTRIAARESHRAAESAQVTALQLAARQQALADLALRAQHRNAVYSILFGFGETRVALSPGAADRLMDEARAAAWIVLRGRTDGRVESPAEARVARERSEAVRAYLVRAGIEPARIRATWQPIGDHAADNGWEGGRRLNRRVEIELYRVVPRFVALDSRPDL